jgi:heme/copper-type cytochrome/quinol oxidase subunit 3
VAEAGATHSTAKREHAGLRVVGAAAALAGGPLWAYAVTRSIVEMDHEIVHDLDATGRATYAAFWLLLTSLMFFGASFWYFTARSRGWSVVRALRVQQLALLAASAGTLLVAAIR